MVPPPDVPSRAKYDEEFKGYRIFIGDLSRRNPSQSEIERAFDKFGDIKMIWVARNPPGFAYVVYNSANAAERAVSKMDNNHFDGRTIRVKHAAPRGRGYSNNRNKDDFRNGNRSPKYSRRERSPQDRKPRRRSRSRSYNRRDERIRKPEKYERPSRKRYSRSISK